MKLEELKLITKVLKLSKVKPNPDNPRFIRDEEYNKLVNSITKSSWMLFLRPIIVNDDMTVLGGNMRLRACKEAGLKEAPVIKASELTEEQQKEFIIRDNIGFGQWDYDILANEWDVEKLNDYGLEIPNLNIEEAEEDNYTEPDDLKVDVVLGDLIEIGEHRLLCGDSTNTDQVAKLMNGEKADAAHNDPPYGMKKENVGVLNDNLNYDDLLEFNKEWIALQFTHLKDNGSWYCWGIEEPLMDIYSNILKSYAKEQKVTFRNLITWDKGHGQGQNSDNTRSYATADEKCLFVMMGVQGFNNNADNYFKEWDSIVNYLKQEKQKSGLTIKDFKRIAGHSENSGCHWFDKSQWMMPTKETYNSWRDYCKNNNNNSFKKEYEVFKKEYEVIKKEYEVIKQEYYLTRAYFDNTHDNMNNVWHFDRHVRQGNEGGHATPKPIPLCERVIKSSCPDGGLVIDSFLGSGSTMVAAHQLKRKCYGMELDPKYCQVIIDRMQKLDDTLQIKINGKEYGK